MSFLRLPLAFMRLLLQSVVVALGHIRANKARSVLTTTGIIIGVASVTAVIAGLTGLKTKILTDFETIGTNKIGVGPHRPDTGPLRRASWVRIKFNPVQSIKNLGAMISFHEVSETEPFAVGSLTIQGLRVQHGPTEIVSFRVMEGGRAVVYAPDVGYETGEISDRIVAHYRDAALLIHDATYLDADWEARRNRGLSSTKWAAAAAIRAGVDALAPFHYDQDYDDATVDRLCEELREFLDDGGGADIRIFAAKEGLSVEI